MDVSFKGAHSWFNDEQTILDLGGCENLVNTSFAHQNLQLQIQTDTSAAAQHIQQSVNGDKFQFTKYVDIQCNFQGHREKVRFYLMDNLPRSFLLGYPFLLDKGAVFKLKASTVILSDVKLTPTLTILPANNLSSSVFVYPGVNSMFLNFQQQQQPFISTLPDFELLFQEFSSIFLESSNDMTKFTSSDNKPIDLDTYNYSSKGPYNYSEFGCKTWNNSSEEKTASGVRLATLSSVSPVSMGSILLVPPVTRMQTDFYVTWPRARQKILS